MSNKVDSFIGSLFGANSHLKVTGWSGDRSDSVKLYDVSCEYCVKDVELFGNGIFKSTKGNLLKGQIPCGCATCRPWTEAQNVVRVKRECDNRGYEFIGFAEEYRGKDTKLRLKCLEHSTYWESTSINKLLQGRGCPACKSKSIALANSNPYDQMVSSFMESGSFADGTVFERSSEKANNGVKSYWNYTCPICSKDEYVNEGLCTGIFKVNGTFLTKGQRSCRCSGKYKWTAEQREYQITKASEGSEVSFNGWVGSHKNQNSKFLAKCSQHGNWPISVSNFLTHKRGCPSCAVTGFDVAKPAHLYVLKVVGESVDFTGYGISNVIEDRLVTHKRKLKNLGFTIEDYLTFPMSGHEAVSLEGKIKLLFTCFPQKVEGFKTEATNAEHYQDVVDFVDSTYKQ